MDFDGPCSSFPISILCVHCPIFRLCVLGDQTPACVSVTRRGCSRGTLPAAWTSAAFAPRCLDLSMCDSLAWCIYCQKQLWRCIRGHPTCCMDRRLWGFATRSLESRSLHSGEIVTSLGMFHCMARMRLIMTCTRCWLGTPPCNTTKQ